MGDVLAVHLAVNGSPMKYLMIEDPIPAGTEFVRNEDSYMIVDRPNAWDWWYTRREFHDDRAVMFATEFEGRHESFYLLKVVNPGAFVVSPAHVVVDTFPSEQGSQRVNDAATLYKAQKKSSRSSRPSPRNAPPGAWRCRRRPRNSSTSFSR